MRDQVQFGAAAPVTLTPEEREAIHPWGAGGEWIPQGAAARAHPELAEAMRWGPAELARESSLERCRLAREAGVLALALATADSQHAEDDTDRAVSHQLTASHTLAMRFTGRAMRALDAAAVGDEAAAFAAARAARVVGRMIHSHRVCYEVIEHKRLKRWQRLADEDRVRRLIAEGRTDTRAE